MLKICCDCIFGANNNNETAYGVTNSHRTGQWPLQRSENGIMYRIPKALNKGDEIEIEGIMSQNPQSLIISLVTGVNYPDHNNVACQLEIDFLSENEKINIKTINNGNIEESLMDDKPSELFPDLDFKFMFIARPENSIDIYIGESYLNRLKLIHNISDIGFLTVNNDFSKVKHLKFIYG